MDKTKRKEIALLKYSIIAPLITNNISEEIGSKEEFFRDASAKTYTNNEGESLNFASGTIKHWYLKYTKEGFDGLIPKRRSDNGYSRKLDDDIKSEIKFLKQQYTRIPATIIYETLISKGIINKNEISLSTITRYLKTLKNDQSESKKQYLRYEKEHINEVWYGDTSHTCYLLHEGKKKKAYLIALLDDASRMIVGYDLFLEDNYLNLMQVMKSAIIKYGVPKMFSFDNGSNYRNNQIKLLGARIGTTLNYAPPYTPQSKAKIERWFRTFKDQCLSTITDDDKSSLEKLKIKVANFINEYNNRIHTSLEGQSPSVRFFSESNLIRRLDDDTIEKSFLLEIERKVSKDNLISINSEKYEVDYQYCNQRITLRYSPDLKDIFVVNEHNNYKRIKLLNKLDNSKIKREKVNFTREVG